MDIINHVLSAISQLALFALIPFVWYALCHKKCSGFFQWIGLKRPLKFDRTLLGFIVFNNSCFHSGIYRNIIFAKRSRDRNI